VETWHAGAFLGVAERNLAVNILEYWRVHSEDHPGTDHLVQALRKVWMIATVGGTVEFQTLSLMEIVEF